MPCFFAVIRATGEDDGLGVFSFAAGVAGWDALVQFTIALSFVIARLVPGNPVKYASRVA